MQDITVFLTVPEAQAFREFQQHYAVFDLLAKKGVFDTKGGSVTLHFDANGIIQKIERHDSLFDARIK